jgi:hypothetical protein
MNDININLLVGSAVGGVAIVIGIILILHLYGVI